MPLGVAAALYLSEYAPDNALTRIINLAIINLAGVPSIVHALFGVGAFVLFFGFGTSILAASLTLAVMTLPVVIVSTRESLQAVPQEYREACWAMGATRWQTTWRVVLPASKSGMMAAVLLGVGRGFGETMAVLMASGHSVNLPTSPFDSVRALTATIAAELGETAQGSDHYQALFTLGILLFVVTFVINLLADTFVRRGVKT